MLKIIKALSPHESAGGILLIAAMLLALVFANTPLHSFYNHLLATPVSVAIGQFTIAKPLLLWINDGLMTIFFLLIGLELKREMLIGQLNQISKIMLPGFAAVGGMLVPALIYVYSNYHDPVALQGWAIPTATDIAFAIGILSLLGPRIPTSLKIFLVSLAIFDDIGAIVIIAIFYTAKISLMALGVTFVGLAILGWMNRKGVLSISAYCVVGLVVWVSLLKSGVHATLAGIAIAMFIPLEGKDKQGKLHQPLRKLENNLHGPVAFFILPIFAFANAGLPLMGLSVSDILSPVPLGITLGLFVGKQIGVMLFTWLAITLRVGKLADDVSWPQLYGVALLCGIGFTMSLFISSLAFEQVANYQALHDRLGILLGSLLSAVSGYIWLRFCKPHKYNSNA